ncbi:GDSL esterase/lipase [Nymphaea thermarum]|nr:GDSL esterase/lipase [Nymphaea thermarum]
MARPSNLSICCVFFLVFFCLVVFLPTSHSVCPGTVQHAPALFVFGDSVVDNGNNAFRNPGVSTRNLPYGIDFPGGPTGRFTNGKNPGDFLAEDLNLPGLPLAVEDPTAEGSKILNGVNYASGGSGILDNPDSEFMSLGRQVDLFEQKTLPDLKWLFARSGKLAPYLANSIFAFSTGGNDCTKACDDPLNNVEECKGNVKLLVANLTVHLQRLNRLGARKFVLFGAQPLGCNPGYVGNNNNECRPDLNVVVKLFSEELNSSLGSLKEAMPDSYFVYVNAYKITDDVYQNPASQGFEEIKASCCQRNGPGCTPGAEPCPDRDTYMYFDGAHCTSAMYKLLVDGGFCSEDPEIVNPFDISRLAAIQVIPTVKRSPMK